MPYASNDGLRIYYERVGSGPPILLHHGFSLSHRDWWDDGYVDAFRDDYELILLDQRGHGASDKPHDPAAYTLDKRVADVVAVLDDAGIARPIFWGYSLGGAIGYAAMQYAPERFRAFIIGGMHPYARDPEAFRQQAAALRSGGMAGLVEGMERAFGTIAPQARTRALANDAEALAASSIAVGSAPGFADAVAALDRPVLVYVGNQDAFYADAQKAAAGLPHVTFVTVPEVNHMQGLQRLDLVLPTIQSFLANVDDSHLA